MNLKDYQQQIIKVAESQIGVVEPESVKYFTDTDYPDPTGRTPYCAAFCNWVLKRVGVEGVTPALVAKIHRAESLISKVRFVGEKEMLPGSGHADAFSFSYWGWECDEEIIGAIVVFSFSHVSIYHGNGRFLGGNQSKAHEVMIESINMDDAIHWRLPLDVEV